jgi:Uma2 family endonuclease
MSQPAAHASPAAFAPLPADDIIVLENVTWADYQRLLEIRGERPVPRLTYVKGVLELMTPSRPHESIKSMIGRLVEAWCFEHEVAISPYGSWTHESKDAERGVEPDECYVLGDVPQPERCDLAIEVVWSAGGVNKLDAYQPLGIREVWFWKGGRIEVFGLRDTGYAPLPGSEVLPGIDLDALARYIDIKPMTRAVTEYRAALRARVLTDLG